MLQRLSLKNFVLMESLVLDLDKGLNVLTGETGAGKSIILDALGLLLGERFVAESVRQGAERSEIDGQFDAPKSREFQKWWEGHGWEKTEDILIRREGTPDGRSRAFLNDRPVTLGTLQELGEFLVDIHGQFEHQHILKPSVQLALLDRFGDLTEACDQIAPLYHAWQALEQELQAEQISEQERLQRIDLYRFQLQEIDQAKPKTGEAEELASRLPELKNAARLRSLAQDAYGMLYESEGSILERLGQLQKVLATLGTLAASAQPLAAPVQDAQAQLEEAARSLQRLSDQWETDPQALEALLSRQDLLSRLEKKYGGSLEKVISHGEHLRQELNRLENADHYRKELEKRSSQARKTLEEASKELSGKRQAAARRLSQAVKAQLEDLGLGRAQFRVDVTSSDFSTTGIDRVSFEWAPNPGEGIRPLKDIISGGEMSRVMLALKTVLAHADAVATLVFDEVDAGIGGLTAQAVGRKLRSLSRHHQLLCVSHLPQIASCAHAHFHVSKKILKSRTLAVVTRLESGARLEELARLLGSQITPTSVQHAKELLAQNQ